MTSPEPTEIQQAFAVELSEMLADMESALLVAEKRPEDTEAFNQLFRAVHTIKGSAGIVGIGVIEHFCHSIENILVCIRDHKTSLSAALVALLLQCHDHIGVLMQHCSEHDNDDISPPHRHFQLLDQLKTWSHTSMSCENVCETPPENAVDRISESDRIQNDQPEVCTDNAAADSTDNSNIAPPDRNLTAARKSGCIRIEATKLDQFSDLIVELVTAVSVLESHIRQLGNMTVTESAVHIADLSRRLQEKSMAFRTVPMQTLFRRFQRMIRDIEKTTDKRITLLITGGETELDREIIDKLYEPLLHLLRNAADHGIESSPERIRLGKNPVGAIHLRAFHDSGNIVIQVEDDGQGIPVEAVARRAFEKGLISDKSVVNDRNILGYISEPGFSTLDETTMLSGRGVGMDVVKKTVDSLRGHIDIKTHRGDGTMFQITIPLSLSLLDGFLVELGETLYIIPMDIVQETLELPDRDAITRGFIQIRDNILTCMDIHRILFLTDSPPTLQYMVIIKCGDHHVGLPVDRIRGEIKTVIKPLGKLFRNVPYVSGTCILGDGSIALCLEVEKIIRDIENQPCHRADG